MSKSMKMTQRIVWFLGFIYLFIFVSQMICEAKGAQQLPVQYSGIINDSKFDLAGNRVGIRPVYTFHAEVSSNRYRITLIAVHDYSCFEQVAGSDGLDCYFQQKMWHSWADKTTNADFRERADVTPGPFPTFAEEPLQVVWMLLASHKSLTNGQSINLTRINYAPYSKIKAKVEYADSFDWPRKIEMYSPGIHLVEGNEYPMPHPFENGYKLWDLDVTSTGETNGLAFPDKAIFSQFATYISNSDNTAIRKLLEIAIVVTNVSESVLSSDDYFPILSHKDLTATDYRFSPSTPRVDQGPVDVIQYKLLNGKWLDRSNSHVNYIGTEVEMQTRHSVNKISIVQKAIIFGLFAFSTIIFITFLLKQNRG